MYMYMYTHMHIYIYIYMTTELETALKDSYAAHNVILKLEEPSPGSTVGLSRSTQSFPRSYIWVAVKELKLSYHNPKTILFTIYPYYGSIN